MCFSWTAVFSCTLSSAGGCCVVLCSTHSVLVCLSSAGGCWTAVATIPSIKRYAARLLSGFNTIFLWLTAGSMDPGISICLSTLSIMWCEVRVTYISQSLLNIAKGTADPRVEFSFTKVTCLGHFTKHISNTNFDQISSSEYRPSTNFNISTKRQHLDQT